MPCFLCQVDLLRVAGSVSGCAAHRAATAGSWCSSRRDGEPRWSSVGVAACCAAGCGTCYCGRRPLLCLVVDVRVRIALAAAPAIPRHISAGHRDRLCTFPLSHPCLAGRPTPWLLASW